METTNNIFVIIAAGGQYDEEWSGPVCVGHDRTALEQHIAVLEEQQKVLTAQQEQYYAFFTKYDLENPRPTIAHPTPIQRPSFAGLKEHEITREMRNQREAIKQANDEAIRIAHLPLDEYYGKRDEASKAFLQSKGWKLSSMKERTDTYWEIQEVPLFPPPSQSASVEVSTFLSVPQEVQRKMIQQHLGSKLFNAVAADAGDPKSRADLEAAQLQFAAFLETAPETVKLFEDAFRLLDTPDDEDPSTDD